MNNLASALTGVQGERVALCDVAVSAVLQDLLAEVTVAQTYRNDERVNIEAVYTFPLPLDAVLLDLEVEIGGRLLKGVVVEKKAAEDKYEDAVAAGDAAVMLEAIEPGLYTMNVGNLLPRETAKITFTYAILYRWTGDRLRFSLPTTIAARFGESPHRPHQVPEASLTVENQFSLRVEIFGSLRNAQFVCPSHAVDLVTSPDKTVLSLQQPRVVMDRDFILNVKAPQATRSFVRSFVLCGQDGNGVAALASFQPFFPGLQQPRPLNLAIVIDCSGSMQGDSMEQAKQALEGILDGLQPHDRVTLIAFGSSTNVMSDRPLPFNNTNLAKARQFAQALDANMGGTEIGQALHAAYSALGRSESADIFLVTDGEVSDWQTVVNDAKKSGHRIFTVGVGSAVSEAFVRALAAGTGGECELVSPREGMADRVVRHFERMRAPRARRVVVRWPEGAANITPSRIGAVFEGDTVVACARFDRPPTHGGAINEESHAGDSRALFDPVPAHGSAILEVETDRGEVARQELAFAPATPSASPDGLTTVARVAAAARLKELDGVAGLETALRYRLVSPWTNWLVIAPRAEEEKALDIPALRKVPQTLAAGWGGVGSVTAPCPSMRMSSGPAMFADRVPPPPAMHADRVDHAPGIDHAPERSMPFFDRLKPFRRLLGIPPPHLPEPYRRLLVLLAADASRLDVAGALGLLRESGLASEFDDLLRHASNLGLSEGVIAAIILAHLLDGPLGEFLSDQAQAALASLQEHAKEATEALREMGRHGIALVRATQEPAARELLRRRADEDALERFARIQGLLDHLEDAMRRAGERLQNA